MQERIVIAVRHGETEWNREGRFQGQTDIPLNETGREQARLLRERLRHAHAHLYLESETAIVASDLVRAFETAELAFGNPGRPIHQDSALREFRYGIFEGLTRTEIASKYADTFERWFHKEREYAPEGGETRVEVHDRVHRSVDEWLARLPHRHMVVVTHGGVLRQLVHRCFLQSPMPKNLPWGNAIPHAMRVTANGWHYEGSL